MITLTYGTFRADKQLFLVALHLDKLVFVGSPNQGVDELQTWFPQAKLMQNDAKVQLVGQQLMAYFDQQQTQFTLPTEFLMGTPLQQQVWRALQTVPYGKTVTYSQLAEKVGHPQAIRAVATAVARNPLLIVVPCHRVIRKDGAFGNYRAGTAFKQHLLALEQATD